MIKLKKHPVIVSLLLITLFSFLAYVPLIPFLGFYGDDFFFGYIAHFYGTEGVFKSLVVDRPFNGYLLALNYFNIGLGDNIFLWHLFSLFVRLLGGYALFFLLRKIWPNKLSTVTSITLLFLLYPGFLRQVLPLGFVNYIIALTLWVISLTFNILAVKSTRGFKYNIFTFFGFIFQINTFLQVEFFIGMEVIRPLIISQTLENTISFKTIRKTLPHWGPFFLTLVFFVLWRIFIFKGTRETTDIGWVIQTYYSNPLWIAKIPLEFLYSFISTSLLAFFVPLFINFLRIPLKNTIVSILLGITTVPFLYFYYKKVEESKPDKKFGLQLLLIGLISIIAALVPIIISGRFVRLFNVFDRYTITSIVGVAFLITGILIFRISLKKRRWIMILLITVSIISHLMNGYWHKTMWDKQKDLWWQLYWRAPKIENNAMLILDFPPLSEDILFKDIINKIQWYRFYWVDYQLWAPGNLFFNSEDSPKNHFAGDFLQDKNIPNKISARAIEPVVDRNITYVRNFNNTVIITTPSDKSCLWALDNTREELPENYNELLKSNISYSNLEKLVKLDKPATPPSSIFGQEPLRNWCYYFQKASLARQLKDWDVLSHLTDEVREKNLKPKDVNEWLPFIEGLIISEKYQQVDDLIKNVLQKESNQKTFRDNICKMASRLKTQEIKLYCVL